VEGADDGSLTSLRLDKTSRAERYQIGKALRAQAPRSDLGDWRPAPRRVHPVEQTRAMHFGRLKQLVPIRIGRMAASPFAFLRGSAAIMAADFAHLPATGITPVICGDAHLGNFGFYASPERNLVFDLNDFDEAHPGNWEWDLRRLTTSVWVAGRQNGCTEDACRDAVARCVRSYREHIGRLADTALLKRSFERLDLNRLRKTAKGGKLGPVIDRAAQRARTRTSDRALPRFTEQRGDLRRMVEEPPLITHLPPAETERLAASLDDYLDTLPPHWCHLLGGYTIRDIVLKVVGVGSVGLRAFVALCEGSSPDDVLFLQIKEARRSCIARFVHGDAAWHDHQGQRVVEYQQVLQTVSDPLLGWTTAGGRQYYVRQFRDMKGAIAVDGISAAALGDYASVCGTLLAKGHARSSGASMIAGYLGLSDKADEALCRFAQAYADQTEQDHQALQEAVRTGRLPAEHGV
jgi:uncharacterized protein (DUF2252 family)